MSSLTTRAKPKRPPLPQTHKWQMKKRRWNGLFVTFEGGEGAGKSSLISSLYDYLDDQGHDVLRSREPGGSPLGEMIRNTLLMPPKDVTIGARAELCLFLAARAQHIEEILVPALEDGKIILCDRFNDSTIAYQGIGRGLGMDYVRQLCTQICEGVTPDLTFYLDVAPHVGLHRASSTRAGSDRIESEEVSFHERIRNGFLHIASKEKNRFHIVDAHQPQQDVFEEVIEVVEHRLNRGKQGWE